MIQSEMPAPVEAKTPAATTSKIIPPIMNELLIFALHFARKSRQCARIEQRRLLRGGTPRKTERALDGCRSVVSESAQPTARSSFRAWRPLAGGPACHNAPSGRHQ
jgi:hypothetical protein